jgi:TM2 domain-containing membrane protein YozV
LESNLIKIIIIPIIHIFISSNNHPLHKSNNNNKFTKITILLLYKTIIIIIHIFIIKILKINHSLFPIPKIIITILSKNKPLIENLTLLSQAKEKMLLPTLSVILINLIKPKKKTPLKRKIVKEIFKITLLLKVKKSLSIKNNEKY